VIKKARRFFVQKRPRTVKKLKKLFNMVQGTNLTPIPQGKGDKKNAPCCNVLINNLLHIDFALMKITAIKRICSEKKFYKKQSHIQDL
jgi:hypothetical protein